MVQNKMVLKLAVPSNLFEVVKYITYMAVSHRHAKRWQGTYALRLDQDEENHIQVESKLATYEQTSKNFA